MKKSPCSLKILLLSIVGHAASDAIASSSPPDTTTNDNNNIYAHSQSLETPYYGQHVGVAHADLNDDGAIDLLFAAGRHWVDQSYALINLGPKFDDRGVFAGVKFSDPLPVGPPGSYYQVDVATSSATTASLQQFSITGKGAESGATSSHTTTVLLVGGTCHYDETNSFGSCQKGENTPARVLEVTMSQSSEGGCSIHNSKIHCRLEWKELWVDPSPKGDRNGGFAYFGDVSDNRSGPSVALLGQGGIEIFSPVQDAAASLLNNDSPNDHHQQQATSLSHATAYSSQFVLPAPNTTDPRSDYARYAGYASGRIPSLGGIIAAGRRSDYDAPAKDDRGAILGINALLFFNDTLQNFQTRTLPSSVSGEPYSGNGSYSIQTTNYAFADINGDGVQDLLEATFLYPSQIVPGHPLPQRIHFLDHKGEVMETLVVFHPEEGDVGRSVTTGQIFGDSSLPDVVFASARGVVTLFANLGVEEATGKFLGLEKRTQFLTGDERCQVRDLDVVPLVMMKKENNNGVGDGDGDGDGTCWVGIVCAVACGFEHPEGEPRSLGKNHIFYVKGDETICSRNDFKSAVSIKGELGAKSVE